MRVRRVDGERFVAGAGNREVVSCGRGECRCHIGMACERMLFGECPTRVSQKSVPQECPTGVSHKSVAEECPTRVSYKSVIWTYVAFRTCLHSGSWAPSCLIFSPRSVQQILLTGKRSHKCRSGTRGKKQRKLRCFACSVAFVWHLKTPKKERNLLVGHNVRLPLLNITLLSNGSLS